MNPLRTELLAHPTHIVHHRFAPSWHFVLCTAFAVGSLMVIADARVQAAITDGLQLHNTFDASDIGGAGTAENGDIVLDSGGLTAETGTIVANAIGLGSGKIGGAMTFPGMATNRVSYGNIPILNIGTGDFTVSIWFNSSDLTGANRFLFAKGADGGTTVGYGFYTSKVDSTLRMRATDATTDPHEITTTAPLQLNTWYQAAMTIHENLDGTGTITGYLNGSSAGFANVTGGFTLPLGYNIAGSSLWLGARQTNNPTTPWSGSLDDFAIWNRALGASEIEQLYQAGLQGEDILSPPLEGDVNGDGHVNAADITSLMSALSNRDTFALAHPGVAGTFAGVADINHDGILGNADIQALIGRLIAGGGTTATVPEPSSIVLIVLGSGILCCVRLGRAAYVFKDN